jgi:hypothetical protein
MSGTVVNVLAGVGATCLVVSGLVALGAAVAYLRDRRYQPEVWVVTHPGSEEPVVVTHVPPSDEVIAERELRTGNRRSGGGPGEWASW